MRYFEIAKPSARHILADAHPKEAAPAEPIESGTRKPFKPSRLALVSKLVKSNYSKVTSAAFIDPAFAIAQDSSRPRNRSQPTLSSRVRQTISLACCHSSSDGSSAVAIVTRASPEFRTVM
jgi:hypothetical protein